MEELIKTETHRSVLRVKPAPYAITAMIMGIVSIAVLYFFGWVPAIVALILRSKSMSLYNANPANYKPSTLSFLKAAKICGILGLIISIVSAILYALYMKWIISGDFFRY